MRSEQWSAQLVYDQAKFTPEFCEMTGRIEATRNPGECW